jgi:hypothetical protein
MIKSMYQAEGDNRSRMLAERIAFFLILIVIDISWMISIHASLFIISTSLLHAHVFVTFRNLASFGTATSGRIMDQKTSDPGICMEIVEEEEECPKLVRIAVL